MERREVGGDLKTIEIMSVNNNPTVCIPFLAMLFRILFLHFSPFSFLLYHLERKPFDFFIAVILDFPHDSLIFHLILRRMSKGVSPPFHLPCIHHLDFMLSLSFFACSQAVLNFLFTLNLFRSIIESNYWHSDAFNAIFLRR